MNEQPVSRVVVKCHTCDAELKLENGSWVPVDGRETSDAFNHDPYWAGTETVEVQVLDGAE